MVIFVLLLFDLKLLLKDAIFCRSLFTILVATLALYKRSMFLFNNCNYSFCRIGFKRNGRPIATESDLGRHRKSLSTT